MTNFTFLHNITLMVNQARKIFLSPTGHRRLLFGRQAQGLLNFFVDGRKTPIQQAGTLIAYLIQLTTLVYFFLGSLFWPTQFSTADVFLVSSIVVVISFAVGNFLAGVIATLLLSLSIETLFLPLSFDVLFDPNNMRLGFFALEGFLLGSIFYFKEKKFFQKHSDLTEQIKARIESEESTKQWAFFDEVNQSMSKVISFDGRLEKLANLAVPSLCDWCVITMVENNEVVRTVIAHSDPEKIKWARSWEEKFPPNIHDTKRGIGKVLKTGQSELITKVDIKMINKVLKNPLQRKIIKELNVRSTMTVPLISRNQTIGVMAFISTVQGRHYTTSDLQFVNHFATRAAVSIDNAKLYFEATQQLEQRRKIEEDLKKSRRQLEVIFENVDEGITVQDHTGRLIYASAAAAKLIGFKSPRELLASSSAKIFEKFTLFDHKGAPISPNDLPGRLALKGKTVPEKIIKFRVNETQEERWAAVKATTVFGKNKNVQFVINLFRDITDKKFAEQKKDDFIAIASHELKTPLTSVRGFSELALKKARNLEDKTLVEYLTNIITQSDRSFRLIKDLLDVARLQIGKLLLEKEKTSLINIINDTVNGFKPVEESRRIELKGSFNGSVYGDKVRLGQVLSNLISNSIRYSNPGDPIIIRGAKEKRYLTITIQDFGKGISAFDQKQIFNRYYQGSRGNPQKGLGLGLFISREIINRHHGKIWLESRKNHGTKFFVRLPLIS